MADGENTGKPRRARGAEAPATPAPVEIAMEAEAAGGAPSGVASALLRDQRRLIAADLIHRRWQAASERAGFALKLGTLVLGLAAAGGLAAMAWQAHEAKGVLVQPFAVPPALAERGLTGQVVAAQLLDEMSAIRRATPTALKDDPTVEDATGQDIKVEIPTTGINLGDIQTLLRRWLGQETRVAGEVYRVADGRLAVRVRVPGQAAVRVEGAEGDIEDLTRQAARLALRELQPLRFARWLSFQGDLPGAIAIVQGVAEGRGDPKSRGEAYFAWGVFLAQSGDTRDAIEKYRIGLSLKPEAPWARLDLAGFEGNLGHAEANVAETRRALGQLQAHPDRGMVDGGNDLTGDHRTLAYLESDMPESLRLTAAVDAKPLTGLIWGPGADRDAVRAYAAMHDFQGAFDRAAHPRFAGSALNKAMGAVLLAGARYVATYYSEDWPAVVAQGSAFAAAGGFGKSDAARALSVGNYVLAVAKAKVGDAAGARAIADLAPMDCSHCLFLGGWALSTAGDMAGSERLFQTAARQSKALPQPMHYWGRARLERGDAAGALPLLREAERRQPHWADPFKFEGDALARLGRWEEAEAAYAKAEPLAPKWGGLHLNRGVALARLGKADAARAQWRTASELYLTAEERTALAAAPRSR